MEARSSRGDRGKRLPSAKVCGYPSGCQLQSRIPIGGGTKAMILTSRGKSCPNSSAVFDYSSDVGGQDGFLELADSGQNRAFLNQVVSNRPAAKGCDASGRLL